MMTSGNRLLAGIVMIAFTGCATTATISRTDAPDTEAAIVSSTPDALFVRGSNGKVYRLDRPSVGDIDHPGNVNMTIGGLLLGFVGLLLLSVSAGSENREALTPVGLIYGLPGLGLLAFGSYQYGKSVSAARAFTDYSGPAYREQPLAPSAPQRSRDWLAPPPAADGRGLASPPAADGSEGPSVRRTPHISAAARQDAPPTPPTPAASETLPPPGAPAQPPAP
jgi:hypothetical protein